jgi:phosphoribosylaminoimidazole-succinocarboxamide synthase
MPVRDLTLDLPDRREGKVRVSWSLPRGRRLMVATDRLSAFDHIVAVVPCKGQVLTQLSAWWFERTRDIIDNHLIAVPEPHSMVVVDATPLAVEVVVRGALTGSTGTSVLTRYLAGERLMYGHRFADGIRPHELLARPIVTPTTKARAGEHDEPIAPDEVVDRGLVSREQWATIVDAALRLFERGQACASAAGLILADTKYEFGLDAEGEVILIDEIHTPDSSRVWVRESYDARFAAGREPESLDKEPVRLALAAAGWRGVGAVPDLGADVIDATSRRYVQAYESLTGESFIPAADVDPGELLNLVRETAA